MKKFFALFVTMILVLSCVSAMAETYFGNSVYAEAGYEGDCYNGVAKILNLYEDGTFQLVDNTSIIQAQYCRNRWSMCPASCWCSTSPRCAP